MIHFDWGALRFSWDAIFGRQQVAEEELNAPVFASLKQSSRPLASGFILLCSTCTNGLLTEQYIVLWSSYGTEMMMFVSTTSEFICSSVYYLLGYLSSFSANIILLFTVVKHLLRQTEERNLFVECLEEV